MKKKKKSMRKFSLLLRHLHFRLAEITLMMHHSLTHYDTHDSFGEVFHFNVNVLKKDNLSP